jgi:hypothetical protein
MGSTTPAGKIPALKACEIMAVRTELTRRSRAPIGRVWPRHPKRGRSHFGNGWREVREKEFFD